MNSLTRRIQDNFEELIAKVVASLPTIFSALLVLFAAYFISRRVSQLVYSGVKHRTNDLTTAATFRRIVHFFLMTFGVLLGCSIAIPGFSLDGVVATLGLTSIAVGFAFKDVFENFIAGMMILLSRPFSIGDVVRTQGITGTVEEIGIRSISIRQFDGELVLVPAIKLFSDVVTVVTNRSKRRFEFVVGIAYDTDVSKAIEVIRPALRDLDAVADEPGPIVSVDKFNASSVDLKIYYWSDTAIYDLFATRNLVLDTVKKVLGENNIEIPFPTQTTLIRESRNAI